MPRIYQLVSALVILSAFGIVLYLVWPESEVIVVEPELPVEVVEETPVPFSNSEIIGISVEGRDIVAITYGAGDTHLLLVGGIHGGYEWNSSLLAYAVMDEFENVPEWLPENVKVTVIPDLNPDGTYLVTGTEGEFSIGNVPDPSTRVAEGRFNANAVDLNRNFDCKWAPESTWRGNVVSAGVGPFSEPEAAALRDWVLENRPDAVVFWHSKADNVYASECENGPLPVTLDLMNAYATAGDYGAVPSFDAYPITGDAEGWLASIDIPAITVELETHNSIEWTRNKAGIEALFTYYQQ